MTAAYSTPDQPARRYLISPWVDVLCLGGLTPLFFFLIPHQSFAKTISDSSPFIVLFYLINAPHFTSTYQIYYHDFRRKAFDPSLLLLFRLRYLFAGIAFPVLLAIFILVAALQADTKMIGYTGNLLLLLLGWHYIKQGYGILIVDSVYKKRYLSKVEKWIFRINNFSCWGAFWILQNVMAREYIFFDIAYHPIPVPEHITNIGLMVPLVTSLAVALVIIRRLFSRTNKLPVLGVVSYLTTVYVWLLGFFQPVLLLFIPLLHSLQYQAVIYRYETNRQQAETNPRFSLFVRLSIFALIAGVLGWLGFYLVPHLLDISVHYDRAVFGTTLFTYIFLTFINVHHFVMDGVIWRADNPETKMYLFGSGQRESENTPR